MRFGWELGEVWGGTSVRSWWDLGEILGEISVSVGEIWVKFLGKNWVIF